MIKIKQRKDRRHTLVSISLIILFSIGFILFFKRTEEDYGQEASTSVLYKMSEQYTAGAIFDRNEILLEKGISPGKMQYSQDKTIRTMYSNIIGAEIHKTAASRYSIRGMAAPNLYGYYQDKIRGYKNWLLPNKRKGDDIYLTIDSRIQLNVYESVKQFENAVVTVLNYKTGEIISMVSLPGFDIEETKDYIVDENGYIDTTYKDSCYINKNIQASFLPGSVIKPILLGIALDSNPELVNLTYECEKENHNFNGVSVNCYDGEYHGHMTFEKALACSCNGYPIQVLSKIKEEELQEGLARWGFDKKQLYENRFSFIGSTFYGEGEKNSVNRILGTIGQANCRVNVWDITAMYGAIFNDGIRKNPILFYDKKEKIGTGSEEETVVCSKDTANVLKTALIGVTKNGTGKIFDIEGFTVAGKTGTADIDIEERTVWAVAGILDHEKFPYVITVCLPNQNSSASGSTTAGPVMKNILERLTKEL